MNKLLLLCLACYFSSAGALPAQNQNSVLEVASLLDNTDVFIKYRKFRSEFERMNIDLGKNLTYYEDYETLNIAYNEVQNKYNEFLELIRTDLSDWSEIKNMTRRPTAYADKYLTEYTAVIDVYQNSYLPLYNRILAESNAPRGKFLNPQIIVVGIKVFSAIVDLIKGRKEEKETHLSAIIGTVNDHFYQKLRMKSWAELGIPEPASTRADAGADTPSSDTGDAPPDSDQPLITQVSAPLFSGMRGFVEFHYLDEQDQDQKMNFTAGEGKTITVAARKAHKGSIETANITNRVDYYNSTEPFGDGDQFYLKVNNSAGMYVLTLNADGTVSFLYPFDADNAIQGKNIIVEGRDRNNVTTLPAPDHSVTPPKQRYFTFAGPAARESFCILLTRSDLDIGETRRALEARPEEALHNRIAAVFGAALVQPGSANLSLDGNRLSFDASAAEATVLPLVFYIDRK